MEEFQVNIHLRLCRALCFTRLLFSAQSLLSETLDSLSENRLQDLLKHLPGVCDFIHDLAENLEAQVHVEDNFGVIGQNFILLDHLSVHPLVKNPLLGLIFDILNALLQVRVLGDSLQGVVISDQEIVLICPVELTLALVIVLNLGLHFLKLLPLMVVNLFKQELLQLHPGIHSDLVVEDVLVGTHRYAARSFGHE